MNKTNISAMGDEHTGWLSALDFYKQELGGLRGRLTEIAGKNTNKEIGADVEHYENQVRIQVESIDKLRHDINANLAKSATQAQHNSAGYIDSDLLKTHDSHKERFVEEERIVNELRQNFNKFASKWM